MNILISACLLGTSCRYDGLSKPLPQEILNTLTKRYHLIPVCPEVFGGLPTPRMPAEVQSDRRVIRKDNADITAEYQKGAAEALRLVKLFDCKIAILKARSPSCGKEKIYDGTFSGTLTNKHGITAELLMQNGIRIITEEELPHFLNET